MPPFRLAVGTRGAGRDPWKRALLGLALLVLLMAAVSFLSGKLKGGESAARSLEEGKRAADTAAAEVAASQGDQGTAQAAQVEGDLPEGAGAAPEAEGATSSVVKNTITATGGNGTGAAQVEGDLPEGAGAAPEAESTGQEDLSGKETPGPTSGELTGVSSPGAGGADSFQLGGSLLKVALGLVAVVILVLLVRLLAGGKSKRRIFPAAGRLEVVGFTPLGPASGIYEVKAGNRVLLVGEAEKGLSLLGEMDAEALVAAQDAELLEDEFLALLREEMAAPPEPQARRERGRSLLDELRWKTAKRRGRSRR